MLSGSGSAIFSGLSTQGGRMKPIEFIFTTTFFIGMALFVNSCVADANEHKIPWQIKVLSIDTGIDGKSQYFKGHYLICRSMDDCKDLHGHGTHVGSLILNGPLDKDDKPTNVVCPEVKFYSCNYHPEKKYIMGDLLACLEFAKSIQPDFINFSSSGKTLVQEEYDTYKLLSNTKIVVAAGNEGVNLYETPMYPAIFPRISRISKMADLPNVITVGSRTKLSRAMDSNFADFVVYEEGINVRSAVPLGTANMSGTSMAAAIRTNKLVKERCDALSSR